jgi:hypothetical protein
LTDWHDFEADSFAAPLKDMTAALFGWERSLLEGDTEESRLFREEVDEWWSLKLKKPGFTPRLALQLMGTEVMRDGFHPDIWLAAMQNRLPTEGQNIVITDVRFPNEMKLIGDLGGEIWCIHGRTFPDWWEIAMYEPEHMPGMYPNVHASEWSWVSGDFDREIYNQSTKEDLRNSIDKILTA